MPKHIVLVDDEEDVLSIVGTILRSKGYDVAGYLSALEALDAIAHSRPDMIISDLMMPGMSGMEFIRRVRADRRYATLPIIAFSALGAASNKPPEFWKKGLGCDDFLSKPFDPLDLLGRVEYLFRRDNYVSSQDSSIMTDGAPPEIPMNIDLTAATPADVVKSFIEAWNFRDFKTEYHCLAEEMTGGLSEADYVARRRQTYAEEQGENHRQHVTAVLEESTSRLVSKVVCEREDGTEGRVKRRKETYMLRKAANGWRIVSLKSVALPMLPSRGPVSEES